MDNDHVTKQDLKELEERLGTLLERKLEQLFGAVLDRKLEQFETKVLRGIEGLLRQGEQRLRRAEAKVSTLETTDETMHLRLANLENRVFEIEKQLGFRPPQGT
jgi:hypothetical protein